MSKPSPFGKEFRFQVINQHLDEAGAITAADAWKFVYRELLWIDGSTGLAHLYESDKAQKGRSLWYDRSIVFTKRLCKDFGVRNGPELKTKIDRMFLASLEKLAAIKKAAVDLGEKEATVEAEEGSAEYVPDEDLAAEFVEMLDKAGLKKGAKLDELTRELVAKARFYFTVERKRQNVLGEGFEDLLYLMAIRLGINGGCLHLRKKASALPGFARVSQRERVESPDMAVVIGDRTHMLTSIKWSLRHDRQKQLADEIDCFVELLSQRKFPTYSLVTNEYDPGRLINTCGLNRRGQTIDCIYHINLEYLRLVLSDHPTLKEVEALIESGKLRSLEQWVNELVSLAPAQSAKDSKRRA